jgi:voltage-gated potassium channel
MSEETKQAVRELKTTLMILVVFIIIAVLIISAYSRVDIPNAFQMFLMQLLSAGTGGIFGNIFYVVIIFLTLGVTFYMFEKVIILLSEVRIGGILMSASLSSIKNHFIVCGAGRVGTYAAEKLRKAGQKIVVIESNCQRAQDMRDDGYIVVEGDCMIEETLEKAKITKAKGLLACTGDDHKNVFLVLTSKDLNPEIKVATRVNDQRARNEFERAGADIIVAPEITGGYELADKILSK